MELYQSIEMLVLYILKTYSSSLYIQDVMTAIMRALHSASDGAMLSKTQEHLRNMQRPKSNAAKDAQRKPR